MIFPIFLGFSCFHPRVSGAGAPNMGQVIPVYEHLVNPYHFQKKTNNFRYHGNPKKCQFGMIFPIFWIFLLPPRGSWAGAPNMGHVIHQNDHIIKLYHEYSKEKSLKIVIWIWLQL